MNNPIKEIHRFNKEAGLLDKGYDDFLESSFQVEEALEGFTPSESDISWVANTMRDSQFVFEPKNFSRLVCKKFSKPIPDVDRLDKALDSIVYAVGSCAKLGLNAQEITKALNIVMKHNFTKLNCTKDEYGKLMKPEGFTGPEPELQKILGNRGK